MAKQCYRHESTPSMWQSWMAFAPGDDGTCDHFKPMATAATPDWKSSGKSAHRGGDARTNQDTAQAAPQAVEARRQDPR
jgi:hypothetical protein